MNITAPKVGIQVKTQKFALKTTDTATIFTFFDIASTVANSYDCAKLQEIYGQLHIDKHNRFICDLKG